MSGALKVERVFRSKLGHIAACHVRKGSVHRLDVLAVFRQGVEIYRAPIASLRRFRERPDSVTEGFECGVVLDGAGWEPKQGDELRVVPK